MENSPNPKNEFDEKMKKQLDEYLDYSVLNNDSPCINCKYKNIIQPLILFNFMLKYRNLKFYLDQN